MLRMGVGKGGGRVERRTRTEDGAKAEAGGGGRSSWIRG